ncbi:(S)-ureidoglycine aminohydrolase [Coccomyxa sp. Obi]|nr:(S)-ureidoglycine aminohydrolase [Coccomyxa sp. Obi]
MIKRRWGAVDTLSCTLPWLLVIVQGARSQALESFSWDYAPVLSDNRDQSIQFSDLPGFTRSTYARDHALITPESRVWAGQPNWVNATTAHLISPTAATGANFVMFLAKLGPEGSAGPPPKGIERFTFVLDGLVDVVVGSSKSGDQLHADDYAYFPADTPHSITSLHGAGMLVFERRYALPGRKAAFQSGSTQSLPVLPCAGEVFLLRKLLPQTGDYDFNVHVMDFAPGEYLNVKEVHYNQHGLLLVAGQGIYRLADKWYPVQSGDAIWMAPYVVQWYAALGTQPSRYILYKDTTVDPGL